MMAHPLNAPDHGSDDEKISWTEGEAAEILRDQEEEPDDDELGWEE